MIYRLYGIAETGAQEVSYHWHKRLKAAEPQADNGGLFDIYAFHSKALAYRYGEGVHGQADG